jgi:hypothetical protein
MLQCHSKSVPCRILPQRTTISRHSTNAIAPVTGNAALAFRFSGRALQEMAIYSWVEIDEYNF